jgi:hypothetical protein
MTGTRGTRRWPLFLIASPAAVAIWSGWVGLGGMCGFGVVHPLPGIADSLTINTAITLPVGVEAYGAYALGTWLAPATPERVRTFARRSAIGALTLGMAGQVIYHLLAAAGATRAPWPVIVLVSCIPVVTLGFGAALAHLLRTDPEPVRVTALVPVSAAPGIDRTDPAHADAPAMSREEVVTALAEEIRDAIDAGERWTPDYPAPMDRTGFRRSWCEKAVRDARTAAAFPGARTNGGEAGQARTGQLADANGNGP